MTPSSDTESAWPTCREVLRSSSDPLAVWRACNPVTRADRRQAPLSRLATSQ